MCERHKVELQSASVLLFILTAVTTVRGGVNIRNSLACYVTVREGPESLVELNKQAANFKQKKLIFHMQYVYCWNNVHHTSYIIGQQHCVIMCTAQ